MFGFSAIECFIIIIAIFIALYWITPRKAAWLPMLVTTFLLSYLALKVVPNDSDDLMRYYMQIDYLREYGIDYLHRCFDEGINSWDIYRVCGYYFYLFSKFDNDFLISAVTIFIVYGLMFLVLYKAANHFNVNKLYLFGGCMFFLSTYWYYDTYSGIRNGLAFAVIFACAYYHLVERKFIPLCYLGYVLACLTHSAGIMIVALVVLTELTLNNSGKFMNFMLIFGIIGGGAFVQFLATVTDNSFVQSIAGKAESNKSADSLYTSTLFLVNISMLVIVAIILFYFSIYILNSEYSTDLKRMYKYSSIIVYFMVGSLYSALIFMRIARWILPIIGGLIYMIGMQFQRDKFEKDGNSYTFYYAPFNETIRAKLKPMFNIIFCGYTAVHFWYLLNGSSLYWMHF